MDGKLDLRLGPERDGRVKKVGNQGYIPAMHWHDEIELDFAIRGRAVFVLSDRKYPMKPGTLVWIFPKQEHVIFDQSPDYEMCVALFKPDVLARLCTTEALQTLLAPDTSAMWTRRLERTATDRLIQLVDEVRSARHDPPRYNAGIAYLMLTAWAMYRESAVMPDLPEVHPAVEQAARLIRTERDTPKLAVLAKEVGLSASRLSSLFKEQMGVSLVAYRQQQHLQRFLRLYAASPDRTMLETVLESGFGSYPQFHRVFKQAMGFGPAAYRRKLESGTH